MFEKQAWMQRAGEYPQSDQEYFGLLARAVFSAGLGPKVVESRWKDIGEAFHGFDPVKVKQMDEADVTRLLGDKAVIRNRRKIEAVISNAGTFLEQTHEHPTFHAYLTDLGAGEDLDVVAEELSQTFTHLGRTSALFFLFSAGWRPREAAAAVGA
jgi:3-methyladenine DNA glycosylase Tag